MGLYETGGPARKGVRPADYGHETEGTVVVRIQIAAHHFHVGDRLREVIEERCDHLMRFFDGVTTIHVTLNTEKERRIAELVANVSHGAPVVAKAIADDMYVAVHEAAEKVEKQLRRHKDKIRDRRGREAEPGEPAAEEPATDDELRPDPDEVSEGDVTG